MLQRYALAIGRGEHRHSLLLRAQSAGLCACAETEELLLLAPSTAEFLIGDHSILVGRMFSNAHEPIESLPAGLASAANATEIRRALSSNWGNYALFCGTEQCTSVYRDPSGNVSVYRLSNGAECIFVSDAELAKSLGLLSNPVPDLRFVVHWLQYPFLRTRRTGVLGVSELLPGSLWRRLSSGEWQEDCIWHPSQFVSPGQALEDFAEAASALRDLASTVVPVQVNACGRNLLRLSGGLDSSIIAGCLKLGGVNVSCVNFATKAADGDEREYARLVADACGLSLAEVDETDIGLEAPKRASFGPRINPLLIPIEEVVCDAAASLGVDVLIDGGGGDNLFCSTSSAAPVVDALSALRLRTAGDTINDIAERANCTIWQVMFAASRRLLRRRKGWRENRSFLTDAALQSAPELHPWLENLAAPPGKREHVEALVHIQHFLDRGFQGVRLLHPLLCQPLLELCLRIPSWLWTTGGRDRAVARAAFEGVVPSAVLRRRAKGSLQSMFHRSFARSRLQMQEILLSGELRNAGILDAGAIESALSGSDWRRDETQLRISEMVALELWLRSLTSTSWPIAP